MALQLESLKKDAPPFTHLQIDIDNWKSRVAVQFNIRSLPQLMLYEDGRLVSKKNPKVLRHLKK